MISAQLAWLLMCPRIGEVKARVRFRPEFFKSFFCYCSSSMTLLRRSLTSKVWLLWNSGFQRGLNPWGRDTGATLWPTELWRHWIFQASLRNCINCICNRDDHSLLDFTSAVQCIKYLISFHKIINVDFAFCQILQKVQLMEIPRTLKLGQLERSYLSSLLWKLWEEQAEMVQMTKLIPALFRVWTKDMRTRIQCQRGKLAGIETRVSVCRSILYQFGWVQNNARFTSGELERIFKLSNPIQVLH